MGGASSSHQADEGERLKYIQRNCGTCVCDDVGADSFLPMYIGEGKLGDDRKRYMEQFYGGEHDAQLGNLEERALGERNMDVVDCCAVLSGYSFDADMVDPNLHTSFRTDPSSLYRPDHGGAVLDLPELWKAITVTTAPTEHASHILVPGIGMKSEFREGATYITSDGTRYDAGVVTLGEDPGPLLIPLEWADIGYDWRTAKAGPTKRQQQQLQRCMKPFLRSLMGGVVLKLHLESDEVPSSASKARGQVDPMREDAVKKETATGRNLNAKLSLMVNMSTLLLSVGGVERTIPLTYVRQVCPSPSSDKQDCLIIVKLSSGRFLRLRFDTDDQVAYFGTCFRLLVKGARASTA